MKRNQHPDSGQSWRDSAFMQGLKQFKNSAFMQWLGRLWHAMWRHIRHFWRRFQLTRWVIVAILSVIFVMSAYFTFEAKTAHVGNLKAALSQPTVIYDRKSQKAGELYSQKGTYVSLDKISPNIQNAVLSTEDRNFYHEHGYSIKGLARAFFLLARNKLLHRDYISGGGSTLTQQLVKNAYLSQEQTVTRKAREIFLSIEVENVYSKQDILAMYLNNAYFGHGVWGVEDASERYFGKHATQLTVPESAVLAGMLTSPSGYNPVDQPAASKARRNVVLGLMADNKKISSADAAAYQKTALVTTDNYAPDSSYRYPYFFDAVIDEAISKYGLTEADIMNHGYKIYTTLDQTQQTTMQNLFKNSANFPANASDGTMVQAASIAMDPDNGGVSAVMGGRGEHVFRGFNRATQSLRSPGSTIKPFAVYTPALQNGYYYDSELQDKKQSYGANHYSPSNYGDTYRGEVPMYQALQNSYNAPAVWLLNKIGVQKGYDSVQRFGINLDKSDNNLAMVLGGIKKGVSPETMAQAFTTFANGGKLTQAHFITKIVDASGKVIVDNDYDQPKRIISKNVANEMTSMMLGTFTHGTGVYAKPAGYQVAGKTGTTEADGVGDTTGTTDMWVDGYTPDLVMVNWEGFDQTNKGNHLDVPQGLAVSQLYKAEMTSMLPNTKQTAFTVKDANTLAATESSAESGNVWDEVQQGAGKVGKSIGKGADSLLQKAGDLWNQFTGVLGR
ncbi:PBP1A family penicillin-binding protein [Lactobacillus rossiae]|uniref:PBP1A family penicillin-binding protein n=3 Tax=Furfurilactobacillus TaxID=2767882 RepID=A0A6N9I3H4_9LACO|nr:PBP1A family penicillin-binding protein [Furfurilactobacillus milii]MYV16893.1 PBP1A family penicillin-binding protein [Furfurilactobacillus milii]